jgi:hypothetical protein
MILDAALQFSSAQAFTTGANASTNVVDFGINSGIPSSANGGGARDMGIPGKYPKLLVVVSTTFTSGGAGTLQIALQGAPDDGAGAPGSYATWWTSPAYALATLTVGSRLMDMDFPRPPDGIAVPRFVRLLYTVATADFTGGALNAYLVLDREDYMYQGTDNAIRGAYPAGLVISN